MGVPLLERREAALLGGAALAALAAACGSQAAPINMHLDAVSAEGTSFTLELPGASDPDASAFDPGLALWVHWRNSVGPAGSSELVVDLDRAALPASIEAPGLPAHLADGQVRALVRLRTTNGTLSATIPAESAAVTVAALRSDGARELSYGTFRLTFPADAPYTELSGQWSTVPPPGGAGAIAHDDASGGGDDQGHGGNDSGGPIIPGGSAHIDTGCTGESTDLSGTSCQGCGGEEGSASSCGGCGGDATGTGSSGEGCDCKGDTSDSTTSTGSGCDACDCKGDTTGLHSAGRAGLCPVRGRGSWRLPLEWSPVVALYVATRFRRAKRKR